ASGESLSSLGSTLLALVPPPARGAAEAVAPASETAARPATIPNAPPAVELWVDAAREARLAEHLRGTPSSLVVVPDKESAARWAEGLGAPPRDSRGAGPGPPRGRVRRA